MQYLKYYLEVSVRYLDNKKGGYFMKTLSKKMIKKVLPECVCHLSSINFIIDNFLEDYSRFTTDEIRQMLWGEMDKRCICVT